MAISQAPRIQITEFIMAFVREMMGKESNIKTIVISIFVLAPIVYLLRTTTSGPAVASTSVYYTVDEGETVFAGPGNLIPPFEHDGKIASRVWMFTADGGKTKFVGYLERYTADAKARLESQKGDASAANSKQSAVPMKQSDLEVKKPGPGNHWVNRGDIIAAGKVMNIPMPSSGATIDVALP